MPIGVG